MTDFHRRPNGPPAATTSPFPSIPPGRDLYAVPLRSSWFRWDEIHDTERKALGEFFDSASLSRSPRVYKEYRDFIINKYREDPSRRLKFTDIRKSLVGDVGVLQKVFAFLDSWGLINFSVAGGGEQEGDKGLPAICVEEGRAGGLRVVPFPNSAKGMERPPRFVGNSERSVGGVGAGGVRKPPLSSYSDVFGNDTGLNGLVCGHCGERCTGGHYELRKGGLAVCMKCFEDEKYKGTKTEEEFELNDCVEGSEKAISNEWTDVETLHLLESVIAKRNDWALVSDQARRSKLDCIAKLIQLPFGEHMLSLINSKHNNKHLINSRVEESNQQHFDKQDNVDVKYSQHYTSIDGKEEIIEEIFSEPHLKRRCIALPDASVPLMDQVAALSTVAGPHVAAAAAESSIAALCGENAYARKVFKVGNLAINEFGSITSAAWPKRGSKVEDLLSQDLLKVSDTSNPILEKNFVHLTFQMRAAIATSLGSAAANAKMLADQEDREIELLMSTILEMQIKKLQSKIKHFEELELIMEEEYIQMQKFKDTMLAEWVCILQMANEAGFLKWRDRGFSKSLQVNPG